MVNLIGKRSKFDTKVGSYGGEKRKYASTEYDAGVGLNYMIARYHNPNRDTFISEDPVFGEVGLGATMQRSYVKVRTCTKNGM